MRFAPLGSLLLLVLIQEALDTAFRIQELMLACEKRMAVGANFDFDIIFSRARLDHIATCAADGRFVVNWVNTLLHN